MADDDDQTVELELDQREPGDDSPEALSERERRERPDAVLTPEEARREEELEELHEEDIELAAKEQRELDELRDRRESLSAAQTKEALRLADVAEAKRDRHVNDSIAERQRARVDRPHGRDLLDEAAARRDEPGADATAAAGRRYLRTAEDEDRTARYYERAADRDDAEAQALRNEADRQPELPPAGDAVRNPPSEPPTARKFEKRRKHVKKKRHPGELRDIGLGD